MSNFVFVLDTQLKPLTPCDPGTARRLLTSQKAAIYRRFPFTIVLKKTVEETPKPCRLKIDPGSKVTGLAVLKDSQVLWAAELAHRGQAIKNALLSRHQLRRSRRNRKTRYRKPRFLNRKRQPGWLPPSLQHRVDTTLTWVNRLRKVCPIAAISQELARFDTQKLQNPEVSGVEYQQGELFGYEVREYLLEKWGRKCAYCGVENVPLEVEHIQPRSKGGSDRVSNLTLACHKCNQTKGDRDIRNFLSGKPSVLNRVLKQAKAPLKDAAAVNSTRWKLYQQLQATGLPIEVGTGGTTKHNRTRLELPKTHWLDAACVGVTDTIELRTQQPLKIEAKGHGTRQMCRTDKFGFPKRYVPRLKFVKGFQTGDIVKAIVPQGKKAGTHTGRVAVRSTGLFNMTTAKGLIEGINAKYCRCVHRKDGYTYSFGHRDVLSNCCGA